MDSILKLLDAYGIPIGLRKNSKSKKFKTTLGTFLSFIIILFGLSYVILYAIWYNKEFYEDLVIFERISNYTKINITTDWLDLIDYEISDSIYSLQNEYFSASIAFGFINKTTKEYLSIDLSYLNVELYKQQKMTQKELNEFNMDVNNDSNTNDNSFNTLSPLFFKLCTSIKGISTDDLSNEFNNLLYSYCIMSNFTITEDSPLILKVNSCANNTYMAIDSQSLPDFYEKSLVLGVKYFPDKIYNKCFLKDSDKNLPENTNYTALIMDCYLYNYYRAYYELLNKYYYLKEDFYNNPSIEEFLIESLSILKLKLENSKDNTKINKDVITNYIKKLEDTISKLSNNEDITSTDDHYDKNRYMAFKTDLSLIFQTANAIIKDQYSSNLISNIIENIPIKNSEFFNPFIYSPDTNKDIYIRDVDSDFKIQKEPIICKSEQEISNYLDEVGFIIYEMYQINDNFAINDIMYSDFVYLGSANSYYRSSYLSLNKFTSNNNVFWSFDLTKEVQTSFVNKKSSEIFIKNKKDNLLLEIKILPQDSYTDIIVRRFNLLILFYSLGGLIIILYILFYLLCGAYFNFYKNLYVINKNYYFKQTTDNIFRFEDYVKIRYHQMEVIKRINLENLNNSNNTNQDKDKIILNDKNDRGKFKINNKYIVNDEKINSYKKVIDDFFNNEDDIIFCFNYQKNLSRDVDLFQISINYKNTLYTSMKKDLKIKNEKNQISQVKPPKRFEKIKANRNIIKKKPTKMIMNLKKILKYNININKHHRYMRLKTKYNYIIRYCFRPLVFNFFEFISIKLFCCKRKILKEKENLYNQAMMLFYDEIDINKLFNSYIEFDNIIEVLFTESNNLVLKNLPNQLLIAKSCSENDKIDIKLNSVYNTDLECDSKHISTVRLSKDVDNEVKEIKNKFNEFELKFKNKILKFEEALDILNNFNRNDSYDIRLLNAMGYNEKLLNHISKKREDYKKTRDFMIWLKLGGQIENLNDLLWKKNDKKIVKKRELEMTKKLPHKSSLKNISRLFNFKTLIKIANENDGYSDYDSDKELKDYEFYKEIGEEIIKKEGK